MPLEEEIANRVSASALDILTTTLEVELGESVDAATETYPRLNQVKRYVLARLDDAELTIDNIATAQNVAPRTLHRLFCRRRHNADPMALAAAPRRKLHRTCRRAESRM